MSCIYEIHISVDLANALQELRWIWFCKERRYKAIRVLNDKGSNDVQNMIGKYCSREDEKDVIEYAEELAQDMRDNGFNVCRVKVEGMMMNRNFDQISLCDEKGKYWEFHFKIAINNLDELDRLMKFKDTRNDKMWKHVALSVSSTGETKYPIVTIRLHSGMRDEAIKVKDNVIDAIKAKGFHVYDKLQAECSIYDTYPEEDNGWII